MEAGKDKPVFCASLDAHSATVNCVRFSPSGEILASGSDDHRIFLWRRNEQRTSSTWTFDQVTHRNEITHRMMRGHKSDIYSLSWSPNGLFLASGSTDNTICLWNVRKNKRVNEFDKTHSHYVQGVAWDPRDRYVLSQSCDRTVRVYARKKALKTLCPSLIDDDQQDTTAVATTTAVVANTEVESKEQQQQEPLKKRVKRWNGDEIKSLCRIFKFVKEEKMDNDDDSNNKMIVDDDEEEGEEKKVEEEIVVEGEENIQRDVVDTSEQQQEKNQEDVNEVVMSKEQQQQQPKKKRKLKKIHLFMDETVPSFFRRLDFTPDGSFAIVPTGILGTGPCTFMFARGKWEEPSIRFPCPGNEASIVVRCSPILYKHRSNNNNVITNLPYRMIFAVATFSNVLLYDTSQLAPIGMISEIHYAAITDMSWSADGTILSVCSNDGYCTFVHFEDSELGVRLETEKIPSFMKRALPKVVLPKVVLPKSTTTTTTTTTTTNNTTTEVVHVIKSRPTPVVLSPSENENGNLNKKRAVLMTVSSDLTAAKPSAAFM